MADLLNISLLPMLLTIGTFQLGLLLQKKLKTPIANPVFISVLLVLGFMAVSGFSLEQYQSGMQYTSWLLTPATVCLAIPMYEHFQTLRKNLPAMLAGIAAGAIACLFMVLGLCILFRFDKALTVTVLPKSVTSAIGAPLSTMYGGLASVTAACIIFTGILANILGGFLCRLFRLTDPVSQGVAFGTSGHVIGTAKAAEMSPVAGAASSLAMVVTGLLTSVLFPLFVP